MIDKESFDEWLAHPVTEHVLKHFVSLAEQYRDSWVYMSWMDGNPDPIKLEVYRESAKLAVAMSELKFEDLENEDETKPAIATRR